MMLRLIGFFLCLYLGGYCFYAMVRFAIRGNWIMAVMDFALGVLAWVIWYRILMGKDEPEQQ